MPRDTRPPLAVALLGYGGLIPFVAGALAVVMADVGAAVFAFTIYAVAILAFLGGVQWGLVVVAPSPDHALERLIVGVLAPLIAAAALFTGPVSGLGLLLAGFVGLLAWEGWRRPASAPAWYLPLRLHLTSGVALCLLVVIVSLV